MVAGALYLRSRGGGEGVPIIDRDEPVVVVCARELADVCTDLRSPEIDVRTEDAGATAEALTAGTVTDVDAWLVTEPWPSIVRDRRQRAAEPPLLGDVGAPLGRSPVVVAMWAERAAVLQESCDDDVFDCLGQAAGGTWADAGGRKAWGVVKPALPSPTASGVGLNALGAAAGSRIGRLDFSTRDLEDGDFQSWLTDLKAAVPPNMNTATNLVSNMIAIGPSQVDAVGTVEAQAAPLLARAQNRFGPIELMYPQPMVTVDVVLAPLQGSDDRVREVVAEVAPAVLAQAGWRVEGQQAAQGVPDEPALGPAPQAPPAGALEALRTVWGEIR